MLPRKDLQSHLKSTSEIEKKYDMRIDFMNRTAQFKPNGKSQAQQVSAVHHSEQQTDLGIACITRRKNRNIGLKQ